MLHTATRLTTFFVLLVAFTPTFVFGQANFEAQVRGIVHDATGSVIIGAKVTITDQATNISSSTVTDGRGDYIFNGLHPSTYNLKAESSGFRSEEVVDVVLTVSQRTNIEFSLKVAGLEQRMTVVEAAPTLDTGSAEIGTTVSGQYTREMPLYGRSYFGLVFLSGGVTEAAGNGIRDDYHRAPISSRTASGTRRRKCASMELPSVHPSRGKVETRMSTTRLRWK